MGAETADRRPKGIQGAIAKEQLGRFSHDINKFLNCIVMANEIMLNLKEKVSQSSRNKLVPPPPPAGKVMLDTFCASR